MEEGSVERVVGDGASAMAEHLRAGRTRPLTKMMDAAATWDGATMVVVDDEPVGIASNDSDATEEED